MLLQACVYPRVRSSSNTIPQRVKKAEATPSPSFLRNDTNHRKSRSGALTIPRGGQWQYEPKSTQNRAATQGICLIGR